MTIRVLIGCLVWAAAAGYASTLGASGTALQAVSFQPESVSFAKPFYRWARETAARCDLDIEIAGPDEIPPQRQWYALKTGAVDLHYGPASYYRGALPQADVLTLARNDPAAQRRNGAWERLNRLHNEVLNAWYLTSLAAGVQFFVYTTKPAVDARLDGLRIRAVPLYEAFLQSLGAETHFMPAQTVGHALEQGDIDGFVWPLWSGGLGWEKFVKFRYGPGFLNAASPVLVNLDRWNGLGEAQRECLTRMAVWVEGEWPRWRREEDARQLAQLRAAGIEYADLGPGFGAGAEAILWRMLETAEPAFVRDIKPLVAGGG